MDLSTIVGLFLGIGTVVFGIIMGGVGAQYYVDIPSIAIVVIGSVSPVLIANPLARVTALPGFIGLTIGVPNHNEPKLISDLVGFAERARREGLLALEDNIEDLDDAFMKKGIQLVVDGTDPEVIKTILYTEVDKLEGRHSEVITMFGFWGSMAPAFGMLGTVIGLIAMLANLSDQAGLAKGMATALITTMYGSMMANMWIIPLGKKLEDRNRTEVRSREIVIEGILSIQSGDNPRILLEKLLSFLPPKEREAIKAQTIQD